MSEDPLAEFRKHDGERLRVTVRDPETGEEHDETMTVDASRIDESGVSQAWPALVGEFRRTGQVRFEKLDDGRIRVFLCDADGVPTGIEEVAAPADAVEVGWRLLGRHGVTRDDPPGTLGSED
jgi:hypothetical protein